MSGGAGHQRTLISSVKWFLAIPHLIVVGILMGGSTGGGIAYLLLMTDTYPPFRLDTGGSDPETWLSPPVTDRGDV